jgi:hypothetical protein
MSSSTGLEPAKGLDLLGWKRGVQGTPEHPARFHRALIYLTPAD